MSTVNTSFTTSARSLGQCNPIASLCAVLSLCLLASDASAQGLKLEGVNRLAHSRIIPGAVLPIQATVSNPTENRGEGIVVAIVDGIPDRQSARRFALRPGQSREVDLFLNIPQSVANKESIDIVTRLYEDAGGTEVIQGAGQRAEYKFTLTVEKEANFAAFLMDEEELAVPSWYWPQSHPLMSYEWAIATRIDSGTPRRVANMGSSPLPIHQLDWSVLKSAVVADESKLQDLAFVDSLRSFVEAGGKLWVMLDRVSPTAIRPLLGTNQLCEDVDAVELQEFTVSVIGDSTQIAESDRVVSSEEPLRMRRVLQSGGTVTHEVDGWPAAIWMSVGYGEILLTTLDPAAWVEPRDLSNDPGGNSMGVSAYASRIWASRLALEVNVPTRNLPLVAETSYPLELMGSRVVPKGWIATGLSVFCLLLLVLGVWRWRAGDLRTIGIAIPTLAIVFSGGMVLATSFTRLDQPESVTRLQLIQVAEDGASAVVREQAAVYLKAGRQMDLSGSVDGAVQIDEGLQSGVQRRTQNGFQTWQLNNVSWPPGFWRYSSQFRVPTDDLKVKAILDSDGLRLELPELPSPLEDPVLSYTLGGRMLVGGSGPTRSVDPSLTAKDGRWIAGTLISTEQQRRLEIYKQFFAPGDRKQYLDQVLYGWTDVWPETPGWSQELEKSGSALVALPVELQRPDPMELIDVPHGLVRLQNDESRLGSSLAFDGQTGEWVRELTSAATANLQLVLPKELVPFEAEYLDLMLNMEAPQRDVQLRIETEQGVVFTQDFNEPSIPWSSRVSDPRVLEAAKDGSLNLILEVSERKDLKQGESSSRSVPWQVNNLEASYRGRVVTD